MMRNTETAYIEAGLIEGLMERSGIRENVSLDSGLAIPPVPEVLFGF